MTIKVNEKKLTNKSTITKSEYLQLVALKELSKKYIQLLDNMVKQVQEITGEINYKGDLEFGGHDSDYLYGSRELDDMLRIMNLRVIK